MRMTLSRTAAGAAAVLVMATLAPVNAHHSFGGEFDPNRPVLLKGKIVRVEWVNPHTWIHVEITNEEGVKETWMVEGGSPNSLFRRGVTKDSLPLGTEVVVDGYQARDHTLKRANGRNVTYPDGRRLNLGSADAGAPPADAKPTESAQPPQAPQGPGR